MAEQGGAVEAVPYMKAALVESHRARIARIEAGEQVLVGVNRFTETEPSPLTARTAASSSSTRPSRPSSARRSTRGAAARDDGGGRARRSTSSRAWPRRDGERHAGDARRRARGRRRRASGRRRCATRSAPTARRPASARRPRPPAGEELAALRDEVARVGEQLGRGLKILVGKPGLDGHSNGAEQIAVRARDAGHGGRLRGHPPDARADRALGGRRGRARDRPLDPLRLAPRADPGRARGAARGGRRRHPGRRRRDHPRGRRARPCARRASPRSTRRRTSSSRASCATSSGSSPSATGSPPRRERRAPTPAALGARLRDARPHRRAGRAQPAREPRARRSATRSPRCSPRSRPARARRRGARATSSASPGPPGAGKSTLLSALARVWRARGRTVAVLAVDPSSKRSGGALLGDRARIDADPADRGLFIRSMAARRAARRPRAGHARRRARARRRLRRRRGRDRRRRPVRDGGGRDGRHRRRRRAAGRRRRPPVPQGRDHGGARRARRHQGRPRRDPATARGARPARWRCARSAARAPVLAVSAVPPVAGRRGARRRARRPPRAASTCPPPAPARAPRSARSPTSRPSTASAACARSAAAGPPSASSPSRTRASTPPRWCGRSRPARRLLPELHHLGEALGRRRLRWRRAPSSPCRPSAAGRGACGPSSSASRSRSRCRSRSPCPWRSSSCRASCAVALSAVSVSLTVHAAAQSCAAAMPFLSALRENFDGPVSVPSVAAGRPASARRRRPRPLAARDDVDRVDDRLVLPTPQSIESFSPSRALIVSLPNG